MSGEGPARLIVGPFNRVEGDLEITLDVEDGAVRAAYANSPLFRGFEVMLKGKDPRDALTLTPRICGICSVSQSTAAALALGSAQRLAPTPQGAIAAAIIHGVENVLDHLTHFYLFFMPDFAKPIYADRPWHGEAVARFAAMTGTGARSATEARARLFHVMGILAGKWPHTLAIQPGGVTKAPDARDRVRILAVLRAFRLFLETELFAAPLEEVDALTGEPALEAFAEHHSGGDMARFLAYAQDAGLGAIGRGPNRYMSYGAYPTEEGRHFRAGLVEDGAMAEVDKGAIAEDLSHAYMLGTAAHPFSGETRPDEQMQAPGYSWCKAPRLGGRPVEVGAFARQIVDGHPLAVALGRDGGNVRARVVGRLLEIARTVPQLEAWALALTPGARFMERGGSARSARGAGLVEAARGALGHWLVVENGRIANYQIVAPTTWNFGPRDEAGTPGPVESALEGAPVRPGEKTPISVQHIVRSFDPCMVCTVH